MCVPFVIRDAAGESLPFRMENTMSVNRTELIAAIAERANLTKTEAEAFLSAFQDVLVENVAKGEAVKITGLMGIERVERAARTGRNPRTGEEIQIPAGYGVKLTVGSTLKKAVANN
jgi:histone family protein DNA-binding protein